MALWAYSTVALYTVSVEQVYSCGILEK